MTAVVGGGPVRFGTERQAGLRIPQQRFVVGVDMSGPLRKIWRELLFRQSVCRAG